MVDYRRTSQSPELSLDNSCTLYQNKLNPFNQETEIEFYIASKIRNASLFIYDMQGRGHSSVTIHGSELNPGMYLYTG